MAEQTVKIIAECVCDLPRHLLQKYDVDVIQFEIATENGVFLDQSEITARNVFEHMDAGGQKASSSAPPPDVYRRRFEKYLEQYQEVILVAISAKISDSCANAHTAAAELGPLEKRVRIFDSEHLSVGLGFMVLRAGELARSGARAEDILSELSAMRQRVCASFIARDTEYLFRSGKVSKRVRNLCSALSAHPVLAMRDGRIVLKAVTFGDYEKACRRYIRKFLKSGRQIDKTAVYLAHAECSWKMVHTMRDEVMGFCPFDTLTVARASATVSSNCGPNTLGIAFMRKAPAGQAAR